MILYKKEGSSAQCSVADPEGVRLNLPPHPPSLNIL